MSVNHIYLGNTFQNPVPIGICLFQGELRQVQYSYTEYGICFATLGSHNDSINTCQIIECGAKERFNLGAALVLKATLKATEMSQLSVSEPRSRRSSPPALA